MYATSISAVLAMNSQSTWGSGLKKKKYDVNREILELISSYLIIKVTDVTLCLSVLWNVQNVFVTIHFHISFVLLCTLI